MPEIQEYSLKEAEVYSLNLLNQKLADQERQRSMEDPHFYESEDPLFTYLETLSSTEIATYVYAYYGLGGMDSSTFGDLRDRSNLPHHTEKASQNYQMDVKGVMQAVYILNNDVYLDSCSETMSGDLMTIYSMDLLDPDEEGVKKSQKNKWKFVRGIVNYATEREYFDRHFRTVDGYCSAIFPDKWNTEEGMRDVFMQYYSLGNYRRQSPKFLRTGVIDFDEMQQPEKDKRYNLIEGARAAAEFRIEGTFGEVYWGNAKGTPRLGYRQQKLGSYTLGRIEERQRFERLGLLLQRIESGDDTSDLSDTERRYLRLCIDSKLETGEFIQGDTQFSQETDGYEASISNRGSLLRKLEGEEGINRFTKYENVVVMQELLDDPGMQGTYFGVIKRIVSEYHRTEVGGYEESSLYDLSDYAADRMRKLVHNIMFGYQYRVDRGTYSTEEIEEVMNDESARIGLLDIIRRMTDSDPRYNERYAPISIPLLAKQLTEEYEFHIGYQDLMALRKLALEVVKRRDLENK